MTRTTSPTTTTQCWPGGQSFTYRGDPQGPANQRSIRNDHPEGARGWRKGTAEEWRTIRIAVTAERYGDHEILHVDSALVGELTKLSNWDDRHVRDLISAFQPEAIENLYADPSDWSAAHCRAYLDEHGIDHDDVPNTDADGVNDAERFRRFATLQDRVRDHANDHPAEVFEWWRVSAWLCQELRASGEVVLDNAYGHWWGRTCTGQAWIMDGVLQTIAARHVTEDR